MFNDEVVNNKRIKKIPNQYQGKVKKIMADLMDTIIEERNKRLMSQEAFAEKLNLSVKTYQGYEQGLRKPSFETLILMLVVLDLDIKLISKTK